MSIGRGTRATLRVQLAPIAIGLGYAMGRTIEHVEEWSAVHYPSPLTLSFLAGLLIAFACRPVLTRLPWTRNMGTLVAVLLLLGLGTVPDRCALWLIGAITGAPLLLAMQGLWPDVLAALVAALLMGLLYTSRTGNIDGRDLRGRLSSRPGRQWLGLLGGWAVFAVVLRLVLGWGDVHLWRGSDPAVAPLFPVNPWELLSDPGGPAAGLGMLAIWWVQALALIVPMVPIALVLRGTLAQLLAVFTLLYFVIGDFSPLMTDQPYFSSTWLLARVAVGALEALALGLAATLAIGQVRRAEP